MNLTHPVAVFTKSQIIDGSHCVNAAKSAAVVALEKGTQSRPRRERETHTTAVTVYDVRLLWTSGISQGFGLRLFFLVQ